MDNIISNVNSIYTNGTYASGSGNSLEDKIVRIEDMIPTEIPSARPAALSSSIIS